MPLRNAPPLRSSRCATDGSPSLPRSPHGRQGRAMPAEQGWLARGRGRRAGPAGAAGQDRCSGRWASGVRTVAAGLPPVDHVWSSARRRSGGRSVLPRSGRQGRDRGDRVQGQSEPTAGLGQAGTFALACPRAHWCHGPVRIGRRRPQGDVPATISGACCAACSGALFALRGGVGKCAAVTAESGILRPAGYLLLP